MATAPRQAKGARKGPPDPTNQRRTPQAWGGIRSSPTYSAAANSARPSQPPPPQQPSQQQSFPPLAPPNGTPRPDPSRDRVLQALTGLTGTTVTLVTKPGQRYEGTVSSTSPEGDTPGVTLRNVKDISTPGAPLKDSVFVPATEIANYSSGPADAKFTNGDTFRTDTDISQKKAGPRERDLQAWVAPTSDSNPAPAASNGALGQDEETFGSSSNGTWDQFAANEQLFGVKAGFDENLYTTKIDRNAPDFKERERRALRIANEIMGTTTNNPHIAEERGLVDDSGVNEEDKYGAVVRGSNAYIPPGARKAATASNVVTASQPTSPSPVPAIPKVSVNGPDGTTVQAVAPASKAASPAPAGGVAGAQPNKPPADALPAFRTFVTNEMQRLTQKRQALAKSEMDKRMAELVKFSQEFKLNKPIPSDLVPILAKDEDKQKAIKEKAERDAQAANARAIGQATPARGVPVKAADPARKPVTQASSSKNVTAQASTSTSAKATSGTAGAGTPVAKPDAPAVKKPQMVIQAIPPFRGSKKPAAPTPGNGSAPLASGTRLNTNGPSPAATSHQSTNAPPVSPISANRLNVNASSFRPNPKANAFSPVAVSPKAALLNAAAQTVSPKPKQQEVPQGPNPFFGTRPIKKSNPVHIKDDFNPFKHNKVVDASQVAALWPYNGKRYMLMFPTAPHIPNQHAPPPHIVAPMPPPMAPPATYDEDSAQAAARGFMYYPPYGYPQHMMPGMAPPAPHGGYMPGPYMQPMPYPPGMPPPNAMYSPAMGQMPPPGAYMQPPPPGAYPPPNGQGPRPSMPPTPIPGHAHPYYHQSPQLAHAYPMMMPPPPPPAAIPPHGYPEGGGAPPPPVPQMGGHA